MGHDKKCWSTSFLPIHTLRLRVREARNIFYRLLTEKKINTIQSLTTKLQARFKKVCDQKGWIQKKKNSFFFFLLPNMPAFTSGHQKSIQLKKIAKKDKKIIWEFQFSRIIVNIQVYLKNSCFKKEVYIYVIPIQIYH